MGLLSSVGNWRGDDEMLESPSYDGGLLEDSNEDGCVTAAASTAETAIGSGRAPHSQGEIPPSEELTSGHSN